MNFIIYKSSINSFDKCTANSEVLRLLTVIPNVVIPGKF